MHRHVNAIAGRLSLRPPQRRSLEILDRITEIVPPRKGSDVTAALETIRSEFPTMTDLEREFPLLCFACHWGRKDTAHRVIRRKSSAPAGETIRQGYSPYNREPRLRVRSRALLRKIVCGHDNGGRVMLSRVRTSSMVPPIKIINQRTPAAANTHVRRLL